MTTHPPLAPSQRGLTARGGRAGALVALLALGLGGSCEINAPCRPDTIFITVTLSGTALQAAKIEATIGIDGTSTPGPHGIFDRPADQTTTTLEADFKDGIYPVGKKITLTLIARNNQDVPLATATEIIEPVAPGCDTIDIQLGGTAADGADASDARDGGEPMGGGGMGGTGTGAGGTLATGTGGRGGTGGAAGAGTGGAASGGETGGAAGNGSGGSAGSGPDGGGPDGARGGAAGRGSGGAVGSGSGGVAGSGSGGAAGRGSGGAAGTAVDAGAGDAPLDVPVDAPVGDAPLDVPVDAPVG